MGVENYPAWAKDLADKAGVDALVPYIASVFYPGVTLAAWLGTHRAAIAPRQCIEPERKREIVQQHHEQRGRMRYAEHRIERRRNRIEQGRIEQDRQRRPLAIIVEGEFLRGVQRHGAQKIEHEGAVERVARGIHPPDVAGLGKSDVKRRTDRSEQQIRKEIE